VKRGYERVSQKVLRRTRMGISQNLSTLTHGRSGELLLKGRLGGQRGEEVGTFTGGSQGRGAGGIWGPASSSKLLSRVRWPGRRRERKKEKTVDSVLERTFGKKGRC